MRASTQRDAPKTSATSTLLRRIVSTDRPRLDLLLLGLIAAFLFLWRLGAASLADWDEAIYAQVSKELARGGGGWLALHWEYRLWFEKPPLLMWTTAAFYRVFGVTEFWSRAASAFSAIAVVLVTYLIGRHVRGRRVGLFAALILLTSYHFISFGRFGTTDMMLTLFIYLAVYAYLRAAGSEKQVWWLAVGVSTGLALMVKGAAGLVAPAAIVLSLVFDGRLREALRSSYFWMGALLALAVAAPWHVLLFLKYGRAFIDEYFGFHFIARATTALEGHTSSPLFYVLKLIDGFFPWVLVLPFAIFSSVRSRNRDGASGSHVLLILAALVLILYTIIRTRLMWYILPVYPALAVIVSAFLVRAYGAADPARRTRRRIVAAVCVLPVAVGGAYSLLFLSLNRMANEPLAKLARLAASANDSERDSLVLFSEPEVLDRPAALFYSDRPLQQAYARNRPDSPRPTRYDRLENLADITRHTTKRIIMPKEEVERLSADYEIQVVAEAAPLVYATIKRKD